MCFLFKDKAWKTQRPEFRFNYVFIQFTQIQRSAVWLFMVLLFLCLHNSILIVVINKNEWLQSWKLQSKWYAI